ncbi:MAG: ergothioneine biosynthesis protein EgtB [Saprospiraceae bacterium]|nr:ergothioneine biosynthesis protein EgtB [Saprospiraceae bacterium]
MTVTPTYNPAISLLANYEKVRSWSIKICQPLHAEDYVVQPVMDVSPPKWHLGHTTWFFENFILVEQLEGYEPFNLQLNYFFNSYYESQGPRILRTKRGNMTRPTLDTILQYRDHVDQYMSKWLQQYNEQFLPKELADLVEIGLQHEQQHQELLVTDIKYILGNNPLFPTYKADASAGQAASIVGSPTFTRIEEGIYEVGHEGEGFCWDNELSRHKVYLHSYEIQNRLITNGEYIEFIEAGGYEHFEHWLSEGWEWAKGLSFKAPLHWFKEEGEWYHFTMQGLQKVDPNLPVTHVSYFEADAFARWKGLRLPTEFEWEVACQQWYNEIPKDGNFLEDGHFHPIAQQHEEDYQMLGNVWEWTASSYLPYPNYPRLKGALGEYNGKFMVNQMVLRGGSCATPRSHIRPTYRNFFQTDKRWQFTGIRLAR